MNVLSLFAGIGGLDLGLERAGMTVVGQVEIDPYCRAVLARHWPEVARHDDVRTCTDWWLGEPRPAVDVVAGGFPCQPVSVAGQRRAQADQRWLWPATWAVIRDLRPRIAVLENVPGLLARGMGDVLGDLAEIGYDAEWDCIPAAAVGAPHRRDRVFVVAYPGGESGRAQPEPEPRGRGAAVAGNDGAERHVADTASTGCSTQFGKCGKPTSVGASVAISSRRSTVAHADSPRQLQPPWCLGGEWRRPSDSGWWVAESDVGRVAYGVPGRVDRLRALGNAVVPQVAEHIGRMILAGAVTCG